MCVPALCYYYDSIPIFKTEIFNFIHLQEVKVCVDKWENDYHSKKQQISLCEITQYLALALEILIIVKYPQALYDI